MNKIDIVDRLPGYDGSLPYKTHSGYVHIGDGRNIFYILVEAKTNAKKAPLLFWTNGGPGCSGLMGMFEELGPYIPTRNGKLELNPWTWAKFANIVFIEQPVGVGFSYGDSKSDYSSNDQLSAVHNLQFVLGFYDKYPSFVKNHVYITSESYGGHYVPLWVANIFKHNAAVAEGKKSAGSVIIPIKGCVMINPFVDFVSGSEVQVETYWGHQRIPAKTWRRFVKHGCHATGKRWKKPWKNGKCQSIAYEVDDIVGKVNPYAIDHPVCVSGQQNAIVNLYRRKRRTTRKVYRPCEDKFTAKYLNRKDVAKALNVRPEGTRRKWKACSDVSKYRIHDSDKSTVPVINRILNKDFPGGFKIFVMSGTSDAICGTVGTQEWIEELDMTPKKQWKQYFVNKEPAGYVNVYRAGKNRFIFATVNGAGHEVPMYKPQAAYELMKKFLSGDLEK